MMIILLFVLMQILFWAEALHICVSIIIVFIDNQFQCLPNTDQPWHRGLGFIQSVKYCFYPEISIKVLSKSMYKISNLKHIVKFIINPHILITAVL